MLCFHFYFTDEKNEALRISINFSRPYNRYIIKPRFQYRTLSPNIMYLIPGSHFSPEQFHIQSKLTWLKYLTLCWLKSQWVCVGGSVMVPRIPVVSVISQSQTCIAFHGCITFSPPVWLSEACERCHCFVVSPAHKRWWATSEEERTSPIVRH